MTQAFIKLIVMPSTLFLLTISIIAAGNIDLLVGDYLFALEGQQWQLKHAWITETVIHEYGRTLVGGMLIGLLGAIILSYRFDTLRAVRPGLYYILVSALISVTVVNALKALTGIDCPWDLNRYGGTQSYVALFSAHPDGQVPGACFPSGHASGAYSWLGVFFFAGLYKPKWRYAALTAVLSLGVVFGAAQQLRGAHFLSHDIWTLYICWTCASLCYLYWFRLPQRPNRLAGEN